MTSEVKMYMLISGMPVITYEEHLDQGVMWEFPTGVIFIPPQRPGMEPNIHFSLLNHNVLAKSQKAFPKMDMILYTMHPTDQLLESYKKIVEEIKMKLSGLVSAPKKLIV